MASNITVDTLTKGSTTLNTDEIVDTNSSQVCKVWVCMELRNTMTIHESFNVSSITDVAVGHVQVNYSSPLSSNYYSYAGAAELTNANNAMTAAAYSVSNSFIKMVYEDVDAGFTDYARATVQVFSN